MKLKYSLVILNLFFIVSILIISGLILFLRSGLESGLHTIMIMYVILTSATLTPLLLLNWRKNNDQNYQIFVHFIAVGLLCLPLTYFISEKIFYINLVLSIIGHLVFFWIILKKRKLEFIYAAIVGALGIVFLFIISHKGGIDGLSGFIYMNEKALSGQIHKDHYLFLSLINMINNFDVVSNGLHGVPTFTYHYGFFYFVSKIADLSGENTIIVYSFILMLFSLIFYYSVSLVTLFISEQVDNVIGILVFTITFFLLLQKLLPYGFSYQGQIILSLILAVPVFIFILKGDNNDSKGTNLLIASALFILPIIYFIKISTGLLLTVGLGYKIYSSKNKSFIKLMFLMMLTAIAFYYMESYTDGGTYAEGYSRSVGFNPLINIKSVVLYLICGLSLFVLYSKNKTSFKDLFIDGIKGNFNQANRISYTLMLLASVFISFTFSTHGNNQMLLLSALAIVSSAFIFVFITDNIYLELSYHKIKHKLNTQSYLILLVLVIMMMVSDNGFNSYIRPWLKYVQGDEYNGIKVLVSNFKKEGVLFDKQLLEQINLTPGGIIKNNIDKITGDKNDLLVYIPPGNKEYDKIIKRVSVLPFIVPAVSGVPLLRGVPNHNNLPYGGKYYGYTIYGEDSYRHIIIDEEEMCKQTTNLGFKRIFVVNGIKKASNYVLNCTNNNNEIRL